MRVEDQLPIIEEQSTHLEAQVETLKKYERRALDCLAQYLEAILKMYRVGAASYVSIQCTGVPRTYSGIAIPFSDESKNYLVYLNEVPVYWWTAVRFPSDSEPPQISLVNQIRLPDENLATLGLTIDELLTALQGLEAHVTNITTTKQAAREEALQAREERLAT